MKYLQCLRPDTLTANVLLCLLTYLCLILLLSTLCYLLRMEWQIDVFIVYILTLNGKVSCLDSIVMNGSVITLLCFRRENMPPVEITKVIPVFCNTEFKCYISCTQLCFIIYWPEIHANWDVAYCLFRSLIIFFQATVIHSLTQYSKIIKYMSWKEVGQVVLYLVHQVYLCLSTGSLIHMILICLQVPKCNVFLMITAT